MTEVIKVVALGLIQYEKLSKEDQGVPLETDIDVDEWLSDQAAKTSALDKFHARVPVKYPEDFEFEVWRSGHLID